MSSYYRIYCGEGNSVYDNAAVWSDDCHPDVTDEEWRRMKDGEEVTVDSGCFYGIIMDDEEEE